ncbi:MAG TPA: hypothetical protein VGM56_07285 [Byssovorax sp.]|jgi:hypothetical protein
MQRSVTGPVFVEAAQDLLKKLQDDADPMARKLSGEARGLIDLFDSWANAKPDSTARAAALNKLIDLNRRVLIYVSKKTRA